MEISKATMRHMSKEEGSWSYILRASGEADVFTVPGQEKHVAVSQGPVYAGREIL